MTPYQDLTHESSTLIGASNTAGGISGRGGADSSIDVNNVFADEGRPYLVGEDPESEQHHFCLLLNG